MSSQVQVECPSGLVVQVRGLKTKEANLLADRQAFKQGQVFDRLLDSCWLQTLDAGPYTFSTPDQRPDWGKAHVGDRLVTLLGIRSATFGDVYAFGLQCKDQACRERFEWEIKLSELPRKPLSEDARNALRGDGTLITEVNGRKVRFRLLTGADEAKNARVLRLQRDRLMLAALSIRIVGIEGVKSEEKLKYLENLELQEATALLEALDEQDGGIETEIRVECPMCGLVQEERLPFGATFFLPRKTRKTSSETPEAPETKD